VVPLVRETLLTWAIKRGIHLQQRTTDWRPSGQQWLGLSVWSAWELSELDALALSLHEQRSAHPAAIQVVVVSQGCLEHRSRLVQAGAQVVVHPLSLFQRSLMILADRLNLCYYDPNPLTQGLTERKGVRSQIGSLGN